MGVPFIASPLFQYANMKSWNSYSDIGLLAPEK